MKTKRTLVTLLVLEMSLLCVFYALTTVSPYWKNRFAFPSGTIMMNYANNGSHLIDLLNTSIWKMISLGTDSDITSNSIQIQGDLRQMTMKQTTSPYLKGVPATHHERVKERSLISENLPEFQQIDRKPAWMYSAFFDYVSAQQGKPLVRLFGIALDNLNSTLYCNLSSDKASHHVTGYITNFPDFHHKRQRPSYVDCHLPPGVRPTYVSVSFRPNTNATNRFKITYPGPRIRNFTVCYSILHSRYSWASQLIESIEMNRILGAEHFFVYNYSISPEVDQILRRYQGDGLVTMLPWPLPTNKAHYYSQMTALNDCNYRNRNVSRFVVIVDTDELIIPRNNFSWMELIDSVSPQEYDISAFMHSSDISQRNGTKTGIFEMMSSYFTKNRAPNWTAVPAHFSFSSEEKDNMVKYNILSLTQIWRSSKIFQPKDRSKYIARPEHVSVAGIHFVHKPTPKTTTTMLVGSDVALVHHYRKSVINDAIIDTSIFKFKHLLYPRLMTQYKRFSHILKTHWV